MDSTWEMAWTLSCVLIWVLGSCCAVQIRAQAVGADGRHWALLDPLAFYTPVPLYWGRLRLPFQAPQTQGFDFRRIQLVPRIRAGALPVEPRWTGVLITYSGLTQDRQKSFSHQSEFQDTGTWEVRYSNSRPKRIFLGSWDSIPWSEPDCKEDYPFDKWSPQTIPHWLGTDWLGCRTASSAFYASIAEASFQDGFRITIYPVSARHKPITGYGVPVVTKDPSDGRTNYLIVDISAPVIGGNRAPPKRRSTKPQEPAPNPTLTPGRVAYEASRTMEVRKPEAVIVKVDAGSSPDFFDAINRGKYTVENVRVSPRMRLHLVSDPSDRFDVVPQAPPDEEQAVSNSAASTWMWSVTPKQPGDGRLLLFVYSLVNVDGKETKKQLLEKSLVINVKSKPLPEIQAQTWFDKAMEKIAEEAGKGIAGLIGIVLSGLVVWLWRKLRPKAKPPAPQNWETP